MPCRATSTPTNLATARTSCCSTGRRAMRRMADRAGEAVVGREMDTEGMGRVWGLTGQVSDVRGGVQSPEEVGRTTEPAATGALDLRTMAGWAMNYLIRSPRPELDYEPVFQCHPLRCPPLPPGSDPVVACDTDARMEWEWYYMREISGSTAGRDVEEAF